MEIEGGSLLFLASLFSWGDNGDQAPRCPSWDPGMALQCRCQQDVALHGKERGTRGWLLSSSASQLLPHPTARAVSITSSFTWLWGVGPGLATDMGLSQSIPTVPAGPSHTCTSPGAAPRILGCVPSAEVPMGRASSGQRAWSDRLGGHC